VASLPRRMRPRGSPAADTPSGPARLMRPTDPRGCAQRTRATDAPSGPRGFMIDVRLPTLLYTQCHIAYITTPPSARQLRPRVPRAPVVARASVLWAAAASRPTASGLGLG